jgi:KamA family protein
MTWEDKLKASVDSLEKLRNYLDLSNIEAQQLKEVVKRHPMRITQYYMSLIDPNDPNDPIRRMVIPSMKELNTSGKYDTSGEFENTKLVGLQHKYSQTALILATNRCAAYCRYCFRKRLVGLSNKEIIRKFSEAADYIKDHKEINNVLISGGDPFVLPTQLIEELLELLAPISHLCFIRFGTRVPVTFPGRILGDGDLLEVLERHSQKNKRIHIVTHFNHPREITTKSTDAIDRLIRRGMIISNQTVLLKGVNDNSDTLAELQNKLVSIGVNPYYVFQCRPVKRVKHHFQVSLYRGYKLIENAKTMLNGHGKRFRYIMSHRTGKIEVIGITPNEKYFIFKYHQAKTPSKIGSVFRRRLDKVAGWLDDLEHVISSSLSVNDIIMEELSAFETV